MGTQRLSDKSTRRIAVSTGLKILRAWAHGGYTMRFVTADHQHGWWNKKTKEWGMDDQETVVHYSSCYDELFPNEPRKPYAPPGWLKNAKVIESEVRPHS